MEVNSGRWQEVTPSSFAHERSALEYIRNLLPDRHPFQAWSNFTFLSDQGHVREVDLLVATPSGCYLVEIKNYRGRLTNNGSAWTLRGERRRTLDNPLPLADQKAKELKSLRQLLLTTDQPAHVETLLIELAPLLHAVGQHGPRCWWIRKGDTLRLRLLHSDPDDVDQITAAARQHGAQIHPGIYEPETHGFGGEAGIRVAHRVACQDAHHLAGHLARHRQHHHRHEMFLLLATRLMRSRRPGVT